ncbi:helix-turn-helix domain-containing protein [Marinitenerispora sediminis]|uniref:Transcriptional regulator n=1 Tax=Marinitenerispora sediminis TaxID=1931232 RepID=A0A368T383_9ACTN|nr:helix-turn-helix domain-containing protein [Marinitenerispora sediminis]RCV48647.1 transcriptional regulator [Marinitenerispora sediminis]RCV50592.1 transcriptional regulator [Marinitenerispora sediminis]RCV56102.1 transcriptional regulator [Marinitenerispora sediminis]
MDPTPSPRGRGVPELRALAHPLRLRLLSLLTGTAMSAAEAARAMGETQANVSYHLRRLRAAGLVDLVEEVPIRGGLARRYRHDPDSTDRPAPPGGPAHGAASREDHRLLVSAVAEELRRRSTRRRLDAPGAFTDAELWIDPQVWRDVLERAHQLGTDLHTAARAPHTPGAVPVNATLLLFEMEPGDGGSTARDTSGGGQ